MKAASKAGHRRKTAAEIKPDITNQQQAPHSGARRFGAAARLLTFNMLSKPQK
jgi:hypothetical protein